MKKNLIFKILSIIQIIIGLGFLISFDFTYRGLLQLSYGLVLIIIGIVWLKKSIQIKNE